MTCNSDLSPAPGLVLSPWGGVVLNLGQEHADGEPFVPKELASAQRADHIDPTEMSLVKNGNANLSSLLLCVVVCCGVLLLLLFGALLDGCVMTT